MGVFLHRQILAPMQKHPQLSWEKTDGEHKRHWRGELTEEALSLDLKYLDVAIRSGNALMKEAPWLDLNSFMVEAEKR